MPTLNLQDQFTLQKGPLSDQELILKDLLVRESVFSTPAATTLDPNLIQPISVIGTPIKPTPVAGSSSSGNVVATQLGLVQPGDLITADFMNGVVQSLNQVITYLRNQSRLGTAAPPPATTTPAPAATAGIAGQLKDVVITPADAGNKVTVTFPAGVANSADFSDILIGNTRVDPGDLVKTTDGLFSFQVDKSAFTSGTDVRAVSKSGTSAQQLVQLFK